MDLDDIIEKFKSAIKTIAAFVAIIFIGMWIFARPIDAVVFLVLVIASIYSLTKGRIWEFILLALFAVLGGLAAIFGGMGQLLGL